MGKVKRVITLKYNAADKTTAERLERDLRAAGMETTTELLQGKEHVFIPVLSPQAENDAQINAAISHALDNGQFMIPVVAQKTRLPKLIEHYAVADLSKEDTSSIIARIEAFTGGKDQILMKVHTPRTQAMNRRMGLVLAFLTLFMCSVGLLMVAGGVVQFPQEEYNAVDTAAAETISAEIGQFIDPNLPRTTQEAAQFASTIQAAPTRYRPFMIATATAIAATPQP
jgi:hypothetical protein